MFSKLLVSKARRPKFEFVLKIIDLNNVPLVSGTSYIKWHLPHSTSAEHRGRTPRSAIIEHKVTYDYEKTIPIRLAIAKSNHLQECIIHFEVVQDYSSGVRGEKITLGNVHLNLAEYVEESELGADGEEGVTRRYLMQDSKINSTLKICILMKQLDGERNFIAPPLKTAPVFGGIAGIVAGEQAEQDDVGHVPTVSKSRDHGELQDMYRRTLAAKLSAHSYELTVDVCIEDIFNGGSGWRSDHIGGKPTKSSEDNDEHRHRHHHRSQSGTSMKSSQSQSTITGKTGRLGHNSRSRDLGTAHAQSPDHGASSENSSERGRTGVRRAQEVDEFEVREDLMSWRLPSEVR